MPLHTANIIGSGPNGLAAAITLAQQGVRVTVYERNARLGGACSTAEITLPGFHHDLGSSAYPLGIASPFFRSLPLADFGLRWIQSPAALAHPLDDGSAFTLEPNLADTIAQLSPHDAQAWKRLFASSIRDWPKLVHDFTQPLLRIPTNPIAMAFFGIPALLPALTLANLAFSDTPAKALFAGCAAHSVLPLTHIASAATGIVFVAAAHTTGWPIAASTTPGTSGAQSITNALATYLEYLGGKIVLNADITNLADLPSADATLFDTSVPALTRIAGKCLSPSFQKRVAHFKPGPGIFKLDFALSAPIPWTNPACARAATVHLGGTLPEIARSEHDAFHARTNDNPYVLLVQPSLFDPSRAPEGKHTAWAYCHVPSNSPLTDNAHTEIILDQITRFAPNFRDTILATVANNATTLAAWNPNLIGGDVSGGAMNLTQLLARPTLRQYRTSNPGLYLCSASTPPGGGVHGMCGHLAALVALRDHQDHC